MKLIVDQIIDETTFKKNVIVEIHSVTDHYNGTCSVNVSLNSDTVEAVREIGTMPYTVTWDDTDIINFIKLTLNCE